MPKPAAVLLKCPAPFLGTDAIIDALVDAAVAQSLSVAAVNVNISLDGAELYAYLWLREPTEIRPESLAALVMSGPAAAMRLASVQDIRGASDAAQAAFHYVVETDVVPEAEADLTDWSNKEHLPGLAAVPGTIRARRLLNLDAAPRHHSCYELASRETFESPPWLAVRHTAWSDRVRPHFRNSKRTMFRRVATRML
jgi:hypothetical protein